MPTAREMIERLGGEILEYEEGGKFSVEFRGSRISNDDLACLREFGTIIDLDLSCENITDEGLRNLHGIDSLELLNLDDMNVSTKAVRELHATLPHCLIFYPDGGFLPRSPSPTHRQRVHELAPPEERDVQLELERLNLIGKRNEDGYVHELTPHIGDTVTDSEFAVVSGLHKVKIMELRHSAITDAGLKHLKGLATLRALRLPKRISRAAIEDLQKTLPNCRIVQ